MDTATKAILGFAVVLAAIVALRIRTGNKIEVKTSDIVMALTPIALWLFLTGQIQELAVGELKIVAAVKKAAEVPVSKQLTPLPVQKIEIGAKGEIRNLAELRSHRSQALSFMLGLGTYSGPAIAEYLGALTQDPAFRFLVFTLPDGRLFGMADAQQFAAQARRSDPSISFDALAEALNTSRTAQLEGIPGFIPAERALKTTTHRRAALESMDALDAHTLPVTDAQGALVGVVDRSKLTASMLIDIAAKVEGNEK